MTYIKVNYYNLNLEISGAQEAYNNIVNLCSTLGYTLHKTPKSRGNFSYYPYHEPVTTEAVVTSDGTVLFNWFETDYVLYQDRFIIKTGYYLTLEELSEPPVIIDYSTFTLRPQLTDKEYNEKILWLFNYPDKLEHRLKKFRQRNNFSPLQDHLLSELESDLESGTVKKVWDYRII